MSDTKKQGKHAASWDSSNCEELHRVLFEEAADGIFIADHCGRHVAVNSRGAEMTGYSREELIGMNITDLISPEDLALAPLSMDDLRQGRTVVKERRIRRKNGDLLLVEISARMLPDEKLLVIIRNITESELAETELRESEGKYRQLIETTGTGYVIIDDQGRVIDANQEYAHLTGRQGVEDVIGHSVLEWTAPHDFERNAAEVRKCVEQGFVRHLELDYVTPSGQFVPIEINATILRSTSGALQILTLCRDITARRSIEDALLDLTSHQEALLDALPDIIMEVDFSKTYTWANQAGLVFFGDDVIGKEAVHYFEGEQETYNVVGPLFRGDENVFYVESWQRRKDGQKRLLAWWCRVLKDADGDVTGAISSARDITEIKQAEAEKEGLQSQLLQAQKM